MIKKSIVASISMLLLGIAWLFLLGGLPVRYFIGFNLLFWSLYSMMAVFYYSHIECHHSEPLTRLRRLRRK